MFVSKRENFRSYKKCSSEQLRSLTNSLATFCFPFQSEPEGFAVFHLYVCAAFLIKFANEVMKEKDFQVGGVASPCLQLESRLSCSTVLGVPIHLETE